MFGVWVFKIPFPLNTRGLTHLNSAKVTSGIFHPLSPEMLKMNMCLGKNTTLLPAERNIAGVKKLRHCSLRGEEEGPVKWHHLGTSCIAGRGATGTKPRAGDALQMCPAHTGASGHAALPGLWQQLLGEWGWQQLWREAWTGPVPELKSRGQLLWNRRPDKHGGRHNSPRPLCRPLKQCRLCHCVESLFSFSVSC